MLKVGVVGLGNWGSALANHLSCKGYDVLGWTNQKEVADEINKEHRNPVQQKDIFLSNHLKATINIDDLSDVDLLLLTVPSCALSDVVPMLKVREKTLIVSAIKGLERETLKTPLQYIMQTLGVKENLVAFSGPSFAKDIIRFKPCGIVSAGFNEEVVKKVASVFSSETMRVYFSLDPIGVEIGAVVKNVIALATGVCDGMDLGESAKAVLVTRGMAEILRLGLALGGKEKTLFGLSGLGDLILTATCDTSRNRTVGLRLGRGESLDYIIKTLGSVAESVSTTPLVLQLAKKHNISMPISEQVGKLLKGQVKPEQMLQELIDRPLKYEF